MSPTSYQTAPPRAILLRAPSPGRREIIAWRYPLVKASPPQVPEEPLDQDRAETGEALGLRGGFRGLGDDDVGEGLLLDIALVALDPLEHRELALPPAAPARFAETAGEEGLGEDLPVPQEAVLPAVEGAVQGQGGLALEVRIGIQAIVGAPHPVEVGGRQAEPAAVPQHPVRLEEEADRGLDRQVLQEVLGVDRL